MDESYNSPVFGFRDLELMVANSESTVVKANGQVYAKVETSDEFTIHTDELHMFIDYELEYALRKYDNSHYAPAAGLHYLMHLGIVSINKGSHSEYDRMLRMSNQIWRHNLRPTLNNPEAIVETLGGNADSFQLQRLF